MTKTRVAPFFAGGMLKGSAARGAGAAVWGTCGFWLAAGFFWGTGADSFGAGAGFTGLVFSSLAEARAWELPDAGDFFAGAGLAAGDFAAAAWLRLVLTAGAAVGPGTGLFWETAAGAGAPLFWEAAAGAGDFAPGASFFSGAVTEEAGLF